MAEQETMYAAAKRLVTNMRDEGLSKGMFMRMTGCDEAKAMSLIAGMEREGVIEPGFWAALPHEHGWEPLTGRISSGMAHLGERVIPAADNSALLGERCSSCGKGLPRATFIESEREVTLKCDCAPQPDTLTQILDELKAVRELLSDLSGGGVALRTKPTN